ncbi:MAG: thioredoxin domain-containing protein [Actinomycetota bacterium]
MDHPTGEHTNRLIDETSPYLIQHAHNPVDWYPWGDEALARAAELDRPILLSIGYAACHWCHVMERESFEDPEIARLMNHWYVPVKVDREERPDLDAIYMDAVQAMTGHGGWPMTVVLTPDGIPFFGGTYYPPTDRPGMPSFRRVLESVHEAWEERREEIRSEGRRMFEDLMERTTPRPTGEELPADLIETGAAAIGAGFDEEHGGFGRAPKFPQPTVLELLLRVAIRPDALGPDLPERRPALSRHSREIVERTLERMALGGIYDQLGGGFARYTVDRAWLVPHFEKMLYDNAQLARLYAHAWQAWKRPLFRRIALETLEYLLREMRDPSGGFHSSEDADSEGEEGKFYVWGYDEFVQVAADAMEYYGVTRSGNFEGRTILTAAGPEPPAEARAKLLELRAQRVRPGRDDKILTSWNALAATALAEAGPALGRPELVGEAAATADFLLQRLRDPAGRLLHSFKGGRARVPGMLEDYAFLAEALLALWEATFEPRWFDEAVALTERMLELFWDDAEGGFFTTGTDHEQLVARRKEIAESVVPSPNGIAAMVLARLAVLTGKEEYTARTIATLRVAGSLMDRYPQATSSFLSAFDFTRARPKEIAIVGDRQHPVASELLAVVWDRFLPNRVLVGAPPGIASPLLEGKQAFGGTPTAFVCEHYACRAPTSDPKELARQLEA